MWNLTHWKSEFPVWFVCWPPTVPVLVFRRRTGDHMMQDRLHTNMVLKIEKFLEIVMKRVKTKSAAKTSKRKWRNSSQPADVAI